VDVDPAAPIDEIVRVDSDAFHALNDPTSQPCVVHGVPCRSERPAIAATVLIAPLAAGIALVVAKSGESPLEFASQVEPHEGALERAERYQ
jgi:hypothetical protein